MYVCFDVCMYVLMYECMYLCIYVIIVIEHLVFYSSDREVLESGSWLNDNIVSAAQSLMKSHHPHIGGLQNTILQRSNTFDS